MSPDSSKTPGCMTVGVSNSAAPGSPAGPAPAGAARRAQDDAPEELTTLEIPVRDKNAAKDAYKKDGIRIVCLDPAQGGYAKGNESEMEDSKTESQYKLEIAQQIKSE